MGSNSLNSRKLVSLSLLYNVLRTFLKIWVITNLLSVYVVTPLNAHGLLSSTWTVSLNFFHNNHFF